MQTIAWCAIVAAVLLSGWTAVRFIIHGDIIDMVCMIVSVMCLCILVAVATA